jgi:hypothetical protein
MKRGVCCLPGIWSLMQGGSLSRIKNPPGLTPVIMNIKPVDNLPVFLGLSQVVESTQTAAL